MINEAIDRSQGARDRALQRYIVVIPAFKEEIRIRSVVYDVQKYAEHVVVVDDGSPDRTAEEAQVGNAIVLRHTINQGKGAALHSGFEYARRNGFDYVITLDADGQHAPSDVPAFVEAYIRTGIPVLIGNRMTHLESMPPLRRRTNLFMSWLLSRAMGQYVPDTQNGFRLYRCDVIPYVEVGSGGYAAESEILLQAARRGLRIDSVPVQTIYDGEVSGINPFRDTLNFLSMLRRFKGVRRR